jgi:hypothetical protein
MAILTITTDYDGHVYLNVGTGEYIKNTTAGEARVGFSSKDNYKYRSFFRFPLTDLPSNANISQVRLYVYCRYYGSSTHLTDIHAYGTNGQENPEVDTGQTLYDRCASGNLYVDDSVDLRTSGDKWFVLAGSVAQDIINAKNVVNRFSLALHEEGDNDTYAALDTLETSAGYPAKLEITYIVPVVAKRIIGDSLSLVVF